ncbi:hypothetical protein AB833_29375 [Chromatiales bacterium (ex Bugula neritina AB1)]|nr:hypothetical protein AB833_29375 [Chromatiales bacterium (ex Bugula neritina AB1)]
MNSNAFQQFAEAAAQRTSSPAVTPAQFSRVTILGGGDDAQLLAALCLAHGAEVTLFSAYGAELGHLRDSGSIALRGDGPIGNYAIDQSGIPSIRTTAELDRAVAGVEAVFLTGPVHKQRTYAMVLADHLRDGQCVVIAPGRSMAAVEASWLLRVGGCSADITLVEIQGLPYWSTASGTMLQLQSAAAVTAATLPAGRNDIIDGLKNFLPNLQAVQNTTQSSFADGSGLIEVPALIMGGAALQDAALRLPEGAVPLAENETFRSMIGSEHRQVIEQLAEERCRVAAAFGVRTMPSVDDWLDSCAGSLRGAGSRSQPDHATARNLVRCATIGSLVPLQSASEIAGIDVPVTQSLITLAGAVLGTEVRTSGRHLSHMGVDTTDIDAARRSLDQLNRGRH